MKIEVIAIGDEILSGFTLNANSTFISHALFQEGYQVTQHTVLADESEALRVGLERAIAENQLVICTGGLGPTPDDGTRKAVADLVGGGFLLDERIAEDLKKRYGPDLPSLENQATRPAKAEPLLNGVGTAPGLLFSLKRCLLILLPGVPVEMEALFTEQVLPRLLRDVPPQKKEHRDELHFFQTREVDVDAVIRSLADSDVQIGIYPRLGVVSVRLAADRAAKLVPVRSALTRALGDRLFEAPTGRLEEAVHRTALKAKVKIAAAESCSGGGIATALTSYSGASDFFLGSIIAYSNQLKESLLQVKPATLRTHGAVSEETAIEMVEGLLEVTGADLGVSVTGIAGPLGGSEEKPVGTVCFGIARQGRATRSLTCHFRGNRPAITRRAINHALSELLIEMR
jgi:nicotinamide-nucleotide amidase